MPSRDEAWKTVMAELSARIEAKQNQVRLIEREIEELLQIRRTLKPMSRMPLDLALGPMFRGPYARLRTTPQATVAFLNNLKPGRSASTRMIADALVEGGFSLQSKDLTAAVRTALRRLEVQGKAIRTSNGQWAGSTPTLSLGLGEGGE